MNIYIYILSLYVEAIYKFFHGSYVLSRGYRHRFQDVLIVSLPRLSRRVFSRIVLYGADRLSSRRKVISVIFRYRSEPGSWSGGSDHYALPHGWLHLGLLGAAGIPLILLLRFLNFTPFHFAFAKMKG